ncbi:hypothetical protein [Herbaspirillum huttiense]
MLGRDDLSVAAIAVQLGFTKPSTFHRDFHKWAEKSLRIFRQSLCMSG